MKGKDYLKAQINLLLQWKGEITLVLVMSLLSICCEHDLHQPKINILQSQNEELYIEGFNEVPQTWA